MPKSKLELNLGNTKSKFSEIPQFITYAKKLILI
jgi:hypothetical protein